ncbi:hypothetical protein CF319_g5481 [Tilletia indica]|uniref:NAD(P)-binding domain-containing protein n=2 Tax=Tilletia TaxID=13289 RepID=A0A8X7NAV4_9BASI|nr:hypothetical protein CF327_g3809 [Tilletia walkeri]KAE8221102.1 hypothetical protein CF319_g5481 [Tilletia indica]KAE8228576.1 hypothetical protein CF326_g6487 [Tilletia indica]KAE8258759.1 hypothetical protein A4X13_0g1464 [Tilletia indica]KAE8268815.1 hypothetical protein A4X09_0g3521 [Tilletia walkeri]
MKYVLLGATRGCGLQVLLQLLKSQDEQGHELFTLSRNKDALIKTLKENDYEFDTASKDPTSKNKLHIFVGDALKSESVQELFNTAGHDIDVIFFSLGGTLTFHSNPFKVPDLNPPSICEKGTDILLETLSAHHQVTPPKLVVISSNGLGKDGHSKLPFGLKTMYGWMLANPHADKEKMEKALHYNAGLPSVDFNPDGEAPATGALLKNLIIVRPALLTDGPVTAKYRSGEGYIRKAYSIRRADVGHFIYVQCLSRGADNGQWHNKSVSIAY